MCKMIKYLAVLFLTAWTVCGCGARSDLVFVSEGEESRKEETAFYTKEQTEDGNAQEEASGDGEETKKPEETSADESSLKEDKAEEEQKGICYVHVCGAVVSPGVYELKEGARIFEAIEMAGGITPDGCGDAVNQAMKVQDGDRIRIPTQEEWQEGNEEPVVRQGDAGDGSQETAEDITGDKININTADAAALCALPGIGMTKAEAIVAYRESNGKFTDISQIQNVAGIKEGLYRKIKDRIKI